MKDGFVKVAAATPKIKVADTEYNAEAIISEVKEACRSCVLPDIPVVICFYRISCYPQPENSWE